MPLVVENAAYFLLPWLSYLEMIKYGLNTIHATKHAY